MTERVKKYMAYIDSLIESNDPDTDWDAETARHLVQIKFFMHERSIHLIVTVLFALMEIASIYVAAVTLNLVSEILSIMFLILLVPYVLHYYFLENSVQHMYHMRDDIRKALEQLPDTK